MRPLLEDLEIVKILMERRGHGFINQFRYTPGCFGRFQPQHTVK